MAGGFSVSYPRTLLFFRLMVSPKSWQAWEKWSISVCSSCWVWVATALIASKQHVSDEGFTYFGHGSEAGEIEKPAIWSRTEVDLFSWCTKCVLQKHSEKNPEESGSEDAALSDHAADVEGFRGVAIELRSPLHVAVEGHDQALQLGWVAHLWQDFEEALPADEV